MKLSTLIQSLPIIGGPSSTLICETDGFHLRGSVISRNGRDLKVDYSAKSEALAFADAVKELVTNLRAQGWKGDQAVLMTPAVFTMVIELPISPKQPRTPLQMQELVRWELEPLLMQHYASWSVGQVLLGLKYLTKAQVAEVIERQKGKSKSGLGDGHGSMYSFRRFGELAIEMGMITQAQLDVSLANQSWLRADSDEISCGWVPLNQTLTHDQFGQPNEQVSYHWLASAVNTGVLRQWEAAFSVQRIKLRQLYPLTGCALELIEINPASLLIESSLNSVSGSALMSGNLMNVQSHKSDLHTELDTCLEIFHKLTTPDVRKIWLACANEGDDDSLRQSLATITGLEVETLSPLSVQASTGMKAIATRLLLNGKAGYIAGISVRGPQPSMFQRVEVRAVAASLVFIVIIGALEVSLYFRKEFAQAEHTRTTVAKKEFDAIVAQAQAKVDAVNKVKEEIKAKSEELNSLNARHDFFAVELAKRTVFVKTFLENLASSVSEDVVINALEETPNMGIRLAAWSLNEKAAQQFIQSFKNAISPLGLELLDPVVRSQTGRLGLVGYDINFRLLEPKPAEVDKKNDVPNQKPGKNL